MYNNISDYFNNPNFERLNLDVVQPFEIEIDAIYNLACPEIPIHYQYDSIMTTRTSFMGVINVL